VPEWLYEWHPTEPIDISENPLEQPPQISRKPITCTESLEWLAESPLRFYKELSHAGSLLKEDKLEQAHECLDRLLVFFPTRKEGLFPDVPSIQAAGGPVLEKLFLRDFSKEELLEQINKQYFEKHEYRQLNDWVSSGGPEEKRLLFKKIICEYIHKSFTPRRPQDFDDHVTLSLNHLHLTSLPDIFQNKFIKDVEAIILLSNKITELPHSLLSLQKLRRLNVENNKLTTYSYTFDTLPNIKRLMLGDNTSITPPVFTTIPFMSKRKVEVNL
jgi:hypothetical protein